MPKQLFRWTFDWTRTFAKIFEQHSELETYLIRRLSPGNARWRRLHLTALFEVVLLTRSNESKQNDFPKRIHGAAIRRAVTQNAFYATIQKRKIIQIRLTQVCWQAILVSSQLRLDAKWSSLLQCAPNK